MMLVEMCGWLSCLEKRWWLWWLVWDAERCSQGVYHPGW
jgi:hypothetical protein